MITHHGISVTFLSTELPEVRVQDLSRVDLYLSLLRRLVERREHYVYTEAEDDRYLEVLDQLCYSMNETEIAQVDEKYADMHRGLQDERAFRTLEKAAKLKDE